MKRAHILALTLALGACTQRSPEARDATAFRGGAIDAPLGREAAPDLDIRLMDGPKGPSKKALQKTQ